MVTMIARGADQRKHLRYELIDFAMLETDDLHDSLRCVVVDVSLGGLQLRTKVPLPKGQHCTLRIARLGRQPLDIGGEICHSNPVPNTDLYLSGIRVLPESHEERVAHTEYVHSVFLRRNDLLAS